MSIAIFVKTPGYSPVNTRLAETIGREAAEALHLQSAATVAAVAEQSGEPVYWAVAETAAKQAPAWQDLPVLVQATGDLGTRMCGIYQRLLREHGQAILIGADAPQLQARELTRATEWLRRPGSRLVMGEATDGGFWLFGGNQEIPAPLWSAVAYGRDDTARQFRVALGQRGEWLALRRYTDLDTGEDLGAVAAELEALDESLLQQRELAGELRRLQATRAGARQAI